MIVVRVWWSSIGGVESTGWPTQEVRSGCGLIHHALRASFVCLCSDLASLVKAIAKTFKTRNLEVILVIPAKKAG